VLFFQPLNGVIRRRLQESAELACDERAVDLTGSARALARSLAQVAAWNLGGDPAVPISAMAHRGGLLLRRVQTLLADGGPGRKRLGTGSVRLLVGGLCAAAVLLPGVGSVGQDGSDGGLQVASAAAAPGQVIIDRPKAMAAADRFQRPAVTVDQHSPPAPAAAAARELPPARARIPTPPLPPPSIMEPVGALVSGVMSGIVPQALGAASKLAPLVGKQAALEMRVERLRERKAQGQLSAEETRQLPGLERDLVQLRAELKQAEKRLEVEIEAAGKEFEKTHGKAFERRMERWGEEYGRSMEKWGEQFGKDMEKWGEQFGKDMEKWEEAFGRGLETGMKSPPAPRSKPQPPADRASDTKAN
jgi:hypothetical protein